jgi:hypothetical protein
MKKSLVQSTASVVGSGESKRFVLFILSPPSGMEQSFNAVIVRFQRLFFSSGRVSCRPICLPRSLYRTGKCSFPRMSSSDAREQKQRIAPRVFSYARPAGNDHTRHKAASIEQASVKTDTVYHVDRRDTWRKIDVCPCFKEESFYPQVVSLFACLNTNFGERSPCEAEQLEVDKAILADMRDKRQARAV